MPRIPGLLERFYQPLYDTAEITSQTTNVNYFQIPVGEENKTQVETCMDKAGHLPYPKGFEIHGFSVIPDLTANPEDVKKFADGAWFRLFIGAKDYLVVPLSLVLDLPDTEDLDKEFEEDTLLALLQLLTKKRRTNPVFRLPKDAIIDLIPIQNFRVEINAPKASNISKNFNLKTVLFGYYKREVH